MRTTNSTKKKEDKKYKIKHKSNNSTIVVPCLLGSKELPGISSGWINLQPNVAIDVHSGDFSSCQEKIKLHEVHSI